MRSRAKGRAKQDAATMRDRLIKGQEKRAGIDDIAAANCFIGEVYRKTVCPHGETARPTLRIRGLLGHAEPILTEEGRAMGDNTVHRLSAAPQCALCQAGRGRRERLRGGLCIEEERASPQVGCQTARIS